MTLRKAMYLYPNKGRPLPADASPYHFTYIDKVECDDILATLAYQLPEALAQFSTYTEESSLYRYAPDKWSVRQTLSHIADTERIFTHRAHWFARGIPGELLSFDQQIAAAHAEADTIPFAALLDDFTNVRRATLSLFDTLPPDAWSRAGIASGHRFTVNALAYMTAGHLNHHLAILRERYASQ
jgi:hypothetical protein